MPSWTAEQNWTKVRWSHLLTASNRRRACSSPYISDYRWLHGLAPIRKRDSVSLTQMRCKYQACPLRRLSKVCVNSDSGACVCTATSVLCPCSSPKFHNIINCLLPEDVACHLKQNWCFSGVSAVVRPTDQYCQLIVVVTNSYISDARWNWPSVLNPHIKSWL